MLRDRRTLVTNVVVRTRIGHAAAALRQTFGAET